MNKRYLCSRHQEQTPSVVVYPDHGWCFGCGSKIPLQELGVSTVEATREASYVEDLEVTLRYIRTLPTKEIRGFQLPYNERGYYIVYPTNDFYKFRVLSDEAGSKYKGPTGHKKPPFKVKMGQGDGIMLVEGEFNALSASLIVADMTIVSPGGAGDFYSAMGKKLLQEVSQFSSIDLVVDADAPGVKAAIESKSILAGLGCSNVKIHLLEKDFNDVHTTEGLEALRSQIERLGMLGGVRRDG